MLELINDHTIFVTLLRFLLCGGVFFTSQLVYSMIGFGSGMISLTLLSFMFDDLKMIVPFFILIGFVTESSVSIKNFKKLRLDLFWMLIFILPGLYFGVRQLTQYKSPKVYLFLGSIIILFGIYHIFFEEKVKISFRSKVWALLFGPLSGTLGGFFGVSGPPLVIYLKGMGLSKAHFRNSILGLFAVMSVVNLSLYAGFGLFSIKSVTSAALMIPFSITGLLTGSKLHDRVDEKKFKLMTSVALTLMGIMLFSKGFK